MDVQKLSEQVSEASKQGSLTKELLLAGNNLYESANSGKLFRRFTPNGELSLGVFCDGNFIVRQVLVSSSSKLNE